MRGISLLAVPVAAAAIALLACPATSSAGGGEPCLGVSAPAAHNQIGYAFSCPENGFGPAGHPYTLVTNRTITGFTNPSGFRCQITSPQSVACAWHRSGNSDRWSGSLTVRGGAGCGTANRMTLDVIDREDSIGGISAPCQLNVESVTPATVTEQTNRCFTTTIAVGRQPISGALVLISGIGKGKTGSRGTVRICGQVPKLPSSVQNVASPFNQCGLVSPGNTLQCQIPITASKQGYDIDLEGGQINVNSAG